jgi:glycosyltransferase involved in cell wall biosynthesis
MHILFLTQIVPYPPDAGPKVKTWHVLRYLAGAGHQVTLATFVRPEEEQHIAVLEKLCHQVFAVPIKRSRIEDIGYLMRSLISGRPFLVERDDLKEMRILVDELLENQDIDVIHADQLTMTQFALSKHAYYELKNVGNGHGRTHPYRIFDAHNAVWTILERVAENLPWYLKPFANFESRKIKQYEGRVIIEFDHTFAVTDIDRAALLSAARNGKNGSYFNEQRVTVIPIAVDTSAIKPVQLEDRSSSIVTLGTLHYPPNADGIRWFFEQVYPKIRDVNPDAELIIIGKNPPPDFIRFAEQNPEQISVTGYVPDLDPYFQNAAVLVIPVRAGGGMRVRILEGLAYGEAIVTTSIGLEGIDAESGKEVIVADSPQEFAEAVLELLGNYELRNEIAKNGRDLVERKYDWQVVLQKVTEIYQEFELNIQGNPSNVE